jgi:hypothetical protein
MCPEFATLRARCALQPLPTPQTDVDPRYFDVSRPRPSGGREKIVQPELCRAREVLRQHEKFSAWHRITIACSAAPVDTMPLSGLVFFCFCLESIFDL